MSVTQSDAAEALRLADQSARRSSVLRGYQSAAPHLILWGAAYALGYGWGFFRPREGGWVWAVIVPVAFAGDIVLGYRDRSKPGGTRVALGLFATFAVFITATVAVMQPQSPRQMAAFVPLVVATCYIVAGMLSGPRLIATGVALGILTLAGFFLLPAYFSIWMAAVGGGALIAGGLWLRTA